ncbi:MAG: hypothetical protein AB1540_08905 [Bdellovibrionota bacterium]
MEETLVQRPEYFKDAPFESQKAGLLMCSRSAVVIPLGRSGQEKKANLKEPRIAQLLTANASGLSENPDSVRDYVFLGYAPQANQVEVNSFNQKSGEWDFEIINNYSAIQTPANRESLAPVPALDDCLECHQSKAPVYPRKPWSESLAFDGPGQRKTFNRSKRAELMKQVLAARKGDVNYHGIRLDRLSIVDQLFFDKHVRAANRHAQAHRVCRHVCKNNVECKRELLEIALSCKSWREFDQIKSKLQKWAEATWPKDGFAYRSSVILDRDPLSGKPGEGTATRVFLDAPGKALKELEERAAREKIVPFRNVLEKFARSGKKEMTYDERTSEIHVGFEDEREEKFAATRGSMADPRTKRDFVEAIPVGEAGNYLFEKATVCMNVGHSIGFDSRFLDSEFDFLTQEERDAIEANRCLPEKIDELLAVWPPSVDETIAILKKNQSATASVFDRELQSGGLSEPQTLMSAIDVATATSAAAEHLQCRVAQKEANPLREDKLPFVTYCSRCHGDLEKSVYPLEHLDDPRKLDQYNRDKRGRPLKGELTVEQVLSDGSMPPEPDQEELEASLDPAAHLMPSAEIREKMLESLNPARHENKRKSQGKTLGPQ